MSRIPKILLAFALSVGALGLRAPRAEAGFRLPGWACRAVMRPIDTVRFDPDAFARARAAWEVELRRPGGEGIALENALARDTGPEDLLAYLEAVAERSGSDLFAMKSFFAADPRAAQRFANELRKTVLAGRIFSGRDARAIVEELYRASLVGKRTGWERLLPMGAREAMTRRVLLAVERHSLEEAFRRLGIFREPRALGKFRRWLGDHRYAVELPLLMGTAALSASYLGHAIPLGRIRALQWKRVPDAWHAAYRAGGLPAIEPLFRREFGALANVDYGWRVFSAAVGVGALGVVTWYVAAYPETVVHAKDWAVFAWQAAFADLSPEALQKYSDEHFDCADARRRREASFRETYEAFEGKPLTERGDPEAWRELRTQVLEAPCDSFRNDYLGK